MKMLYITTIIQTHACSARLCFILNKHILVVVVVVVVVAATSSSIDSIKDGWELI